VLSARAEWLLAKTEFQLPRRTNRPTPPLLPLPNQILQLLAALRIASRDAS
jgi:hypothetical protein